MTQSQVSKPVVLTPRRVLIQRGLSILALGSCSLLTSDLCRGTLAYQTHSFFIFDVCADVFVCTYTVGLRGCRYVLGWGSPSKYQCSKEQGLPETCFPLCNSGTSAWPLTPLCSSLPGVPQTWTSSLTSLWKSCYHSRWRGPGHPSLPALFPAPGALSHLLPRPHPPVRPWSAVSPFPSSWLLLLLGPGGNSQSSPPFFFFFYITS